MLDRVGERVSRLAMFEERGVRRSTFRAMPVRLRGFGLPLVGITLVGLAVRILYTVLADPAVPEVGDANAYHLLAENIAAGRGYIRPFDLSLLEVTRATAEYPPLLPGVASIAALVGVHSVEGQRLWLCVFGALTVPVVGLLGRSLAGPAVGLVAAAVVALHPMLFQADAILMPEGLFALLVAATLLLAYQAMAEPTRLGLLGLGAVAGLASLARTEGLLLVPLLALPAAGRRVGARGVVLALAGALVVLGPWTLRNAVRFGTLVPVSNNSGSALDGANCPATYGGELLGYWRYSPDCFEGFTQPELDRADEAVVAARHRRQGVDYALDHKGRWPVVAAARLGRTWGVFRPGQQVTLATLEGRTRPWETIGTVVDLALLPLAAIGFAVLGRRGVRRWPLVVPIALVSATAVLTYGNQRFRAAATPAIAVLAAATLTPIRLRARKRP